MHIIQTNMRMHLATKGKLACKTSNPSRDPSKGSQILNRQVSQYENSPIQVAKKRRAHTK